MLQSIGPYIHLPHDSAWREVSELLVPENSSKLPWRRDLRNYSRRREMGRLQFTHLRMGSRMPQRWSVPPWGQHSGLLGSTSHGGSKDQVFVGSVPHQCFASCLQIKAFFFFFWTSDWEMISGGFCVKDVSVTRFHTGKQDGRIVMLGGYLLTSLF